MTRPMSYAYLGPEGTFTETAARLVSGGDAELLACTDVPDVVRRVEAGEVERGVVPIENTIEGSVHATLDALAFDTDGRTTGLFRLDHHVIGQ